MIRNHLLDFFRRWPRLSPLSHPRLSHFSFSVSQSFRLEPNFDFAKQLEQLFAWSFVIPLRQRNLSIVLRHYIYIAECLPAKEDPQDVKVTEYGLAAVVDSLTLIRVRPTQLLYACTSYRMRAGYHDFESVLSGPCVGRPRRRVRSCHGRCASTKVIPSKSFKGETEPDVIRRSKARVQPAYCDTATCSFVVSATGTFLKVYSLRLDTLLTFTHPATIQCCSKPANKGMRCRKRRLKSTGTIAQNQRAASGQDDAASCNALTKEVEIRFPLTLLTM